MSAGPPARVVDIITNGINAFPGHDESWTDRYVTWAMIHTDRRVQAFEYYARTLTRRWFSAQQNRAEKIARLIRRYSDAGFRINLVGHSNGADLLLRALALVAPLQSRPLIEDLHLINASANSDCDKNGLNNHLVTSKVWRATVWVGGSDNAMVVASYLPGLYGDLGLKGPINISPMVAYGEVDKDADPGANLRLITRLYPGFHHSTFFETGANFEATMQTITKTWPV